MDLGGANFQRLFLGGLEVFLLPKIGHWVSFVSDRGRRLEGSRDLLKQTTSYPFSRSQARIHDVSSPPLFLFARLAWPNCILCDPGFGDDSRVR